MEVSDPAEASVTEDTPTIDQSVIITEDITTSDEPVSDKESDDIPTVGQIVEVKTTESDNLRKIIEDPYTSDLLFNHMSIAELFHLSNTSDNIEEIVNSHLKRKKEFNPDSKLHIKGYILNFGNYRYVSYCFVLLYTCIFYKE